MTLAVGTRVRTLVERAGVTMNTLVCIPIGTEGEVVNVLPDLNRVTVLFDGYKYQYQFYPEQLKDISLEQQLADAIARAERAEQQVARAVSALEAIRDYAFNPDANTVNAGDMTYADRLVGAGFQAVEALLDMAERNHEGVEDKVVGDVSILP